MFYVLHQIYWSVLMFALRVQLREALFDREFVTSLIKVELHNTYSGRSPPSGFQDVLYHSVSSKSITIRS